MDPRDLTWAEVNESRRSTWSWTGEVVAGELLTRIVAEAGLAPSAFNGQPWRVVASLGDRTADVLPAMGGNAPKIEAAGGHLALFADMQLVSGKAGFYDGSLMRTPEEWAARNVGLFAMNLMSAAWSHGVGTRPMIGFDPAALREAVGAPDTWHPVLAMAVGYPDAAEPRPRTRQPVEDVLTIR